MGLTIERLRRDMADLRSRVEVLEAIAAPAPGEPAPGEPAPDEEPADPAPAPDLPAMVLTDTGPIAASHDGQVIEGLRIFSDDVPGISVRGYANVVIRNVAIHHVGGAGIDVRDAASVRIENVDIVHEGAPFAGPNASAGFNNIVAQDSPDLTIRAVRLTGGSTGVYLVRSPRARISRLEGYDIRGPAPRGHLVQFNASSGGLLEDFSVANSPGTAWIAENVSVFASSDVIVRRGLIDGNGDPAARGVIFEHGTAGDYGCGLVEDVDILNVGNGAFGFTARNVVFRRTRVRDNVCETQDGALPGVSGGLIWAVDPQGSSGIRIEDSVYFNACNPDNVVWDDAVAELVEVREEDFVPRAPIALTFPWE